MTALQLDTLLPCQRSDAADIATWASDLSCEGPPTSDFPREITCWLQYERRGHRLHSPFGDRHGDSGRHFAHRDFMASHARALERCRPLCTVCSKEFGSQEPSQLGRFGRDSIATSELHRAAQLPSAPQVAFSTPCAKVRLQRASQVLRQGVQRLRFKWAAALSMSTRFATCSPRQRPSREGHALQGLLANELLSAKVREPSIDKAGESRNAVHVQGVRRNDQHHSLKHLTDQAMPLVQPERFQRLSTRYGKRL